MAYEDFFFQVEKVIPFYKKETGYISEYQKQKSSDPRQPSTGFHTTDYQTKQLQSLQRL